MPSRLSDIAEKLGVSPSTVSRALSGRSENPALLEEIRRAAELLGYPLDRYDTLLSRSRLLGVVVPNIASPFYASLIERIEQAASHHDFNLLLCSTAYDSEIEQRCLEILAEKRVAGILISPVSTESELPSSILHRRLPLVQVDRKSDRINSDLVQTDGYHGAKQAVALLLRHGYRQIAIISGPSTHSTGKDRLEGYSAALKEAGVAERADFVRQVEFREQGGFEAVLQLLELPDQPDALFVTNVDMTVGALRALYERGVKIPDDIGIVGFDEFPFAKIVAPPLTTVEQPIEMLALTAVDLLVRRIEQRTAAEATTIRLLPKLNLRRSTRGSESSDAAATRPDADQVDDQYNTRDSENYKGVNRTGGAAVQLPAKPISGVRATAY